MLSEINKNTRPEFEDEDFAIPSSWEHDDFSESRLPDLTYAVVTYLSKTIPDLEVNDLIGTMFERIDGIKVYTDKSLNESGKFEVQVGGYFNPIYGAIVMDRDGSRTSTTLPHELLHALSVNQYYLSDKPLVDRNSGMKSGISAKYIESDSTNSVINIEKHANWLNEAVIEDTRDKIFGTPEKGMSYDLYVTILRTIQELIPGIEEKFLDAVFLNGNKSEVWGIIEEKFGPLWLEVVEKQLGQIPIQLEQDIDLSNPDQNPLVILVNALPDEYQDEFGRIFSKNFWDINKWDINSKV